MAFGMGGKNDGEGAVPPFPPQFNTTGEAVLGRGCKIIGQVSLTGNATLDGSLEGEVTSDGTLTIGETANVKAKVNGADVVVRGSLVGDITATRRISLKKPAKVSGNLTAPLFSIEEGVIFEGKVTTTATKAPPEQPKIATLQPK